jgi:hypothetical protein
VAWELTQAGYTVELDYWDWQIGENFVEKMRDALDRADRMVALFSTAYFEPDRHTSAELAALLSDRGPARKRVLPVRIEPVVPPTLYRPLLAADLFDVPESVARRRLISAMRGKTRPDGRPEFPGTGVQEGTSGSRPRLPRSLPKVWNMPPRNAAFTGRDRMIVDMREGLLGGAAVLVQALHGMGGVGKSQLAVEYAHRFAGEYELVWWIDSEQPQLIGDRLAALAVAADLVTSETDTPAAVAAVQKHLRLAERVLLIFDNAGSRDDIWSWLPGGPAHVLVTSRNALWADVARSVAVDVFSRGESVALLQTMLPGLPDADAGRVAQALGDLPLAIAQAGDLLAETGMPVDEYLATLARRAADLLTTDTPPAGYPTSLAAVVRLAADRLAGVDPAAQQLLILCAYLASEPIPLDLFHPRDGGPELPAELATVAGSTLALARSARWLTRYGLAGTTQAGLQIHRLTQAILRDTDPQPAAHRAMAERLLIAAQPDDGTNPAVWPRWSMLLPHILACDPADTDNADLRWLAYATGWHLLARGDARSALDFARPLHTAWTATHGPDEHISLAAAGLLAYAYHELGTYDEARRLNQDILTRVRRLLGDDHPNTLKSAADLAIDLRGLGEFKQALQLEEDVLARSRRIYGEDHPYSLAAANNLANGLNLLGEYQQARELNEDTLARRRRVLGEDHPQTLTSANNLAGDLRELGKHEQARELDEDTLARRRRVLGDDHPQTLDSVSNLAKDMRQLGEYQQARELDQDTLARRRRVLGEDHPHTLTSANNLADDMRQLGEYEQAREVDEDTLARRRRILGDDHPDTLTSANNLVDDLRRLGKQERADG